MVDEFGANSTMREMTHVGFNSFRVIILLITGVGIPESLFELVQSIVVLALGHSLEEALAPDFIVAIQAGAQASPVPRVHIVEFVPGVLLIGDWTDSDECIQFIISSLLSSLKIKHRHCRTVAMTNEGYPFLTSLLENLVNIFV